MLVGSDSPFHLIIDGEEVQRLPARVGLGTQVCVATRVHYTSELERFFFQGWSHGPQGECVVLTEPGEYTANFTREVLLQIRSQVQGYRQSLWVEHGSLTPLVVPQVVEEGPGVRYLFEEWKAGETPFSPDNSIAIFRPMTVEVKWKKEYQFTLEGPEGIPLVGFGWHPEGRRVTLKAPPEVDGPGEQERLRFQHWEVISNHASIIPNAQQAITRFTVDGSYTIAARYEKEYLVLTENPQGTLKKAWAVEGEGLVVETPGFLETGSEQERFSFTGWEGADLELARGPVVVDGPLHLKARYERQFLVTLSAPYGGSGDGWYEEGATATATIKVPQDPSGILFLKRAFDGFSGYSILEPTLEVAVTGPMTIIASYHTQVDVRMLSLIGGVVLVVAIIYLLTQRTLRRRTEPELD